MGRTGITSTASPGKIVKCGWFSKSFAATSFDSARTTRKGSHVVAYVFDAALSDLLGLTEWSTHGDNRALVLFDPCLPRGHSLPLLSPPLRFGKGVPCHHFWAGFAATENSEIGIVGAHAVSFFLLFCYLTL